MYIRSSSQSHTAKKNLAITAISIAVVLTLIIMILPKNIIANADDSHRQKTVTSVLIQKGDTLWSIAGQYMTKEYSSRSEFIKEIKKCNGISSDVIHEDQYLIVPYYTEL